MDIEPRGAEGFDDGSPEPFGVGNNPIKPLKVSPGTTLLDLAPDYVFFNHGVLFSYGRLPFDPAQRHVELSGDHLRLAMAPSLLFDNLANGIPEFQPWEHLLVAVPRDAWEPLRDALLATAILDVSRRVFSQTYLVESGVRDWMQRGAGELSGDVPVSLFGLDGNTGYVSFRPGPSLTAPINVAVAPPRPGAQKIADEVLGLHEIPVDPKRNGRKKS